MKVTRIENAVGEVSKGHSKAGSGEPTEGPNLSGKGAVTW
jgi:hypothetical protein